MFSQPLIKQLFGQYTLVRLYTDGEGQVFEKQQQMQQEKFGTVALPLYAVVNGDGNALTTFPGLTRDQTEFVSLLKIGQTKFAPNLVSFKLDN